MSLRELTIAARPDFPWLSAGEPGPVEALMRRLHWLRAGERVLACDRAGEGNMNLTLRVRTDQRSLVLKQARPWVEKYDTIAAPWDRSLVEQRFYDRVATIHAVAIRMPRIIASDAAARVILMEDLGAARDFTDLYRGGEIAEEQVRELARYLRALHEVTEDDEPDPILLNREMRALNHAHIYEIPLRENNGVELDKHELWLDRQAAVLRADKAYVRKVAALGQRYLADGPSLLQGDFFPGSWLRAGEDVKIIDPEFCYYGDPEYDLGVAVAHFRMARQDLDFVREFLRAYSGRDLAVRYDVRLLAQFAGVEVMRRLLGVAQLPIPPTQGFRAQLLRASRAALMEESLEGLWA
jgi:5-methylthioribose kinase